MNKTAVVILNYNGAKFLRQFLPSVIQHTKNADIIVADNGSTDDSRSILDNEFPTVKVIQLDKNYGFCGGYNRALAQVESEYLVLLNSDIEVTAGWLEPLVSVLDRFKDVDAVQPKILAFDDKTRFEHAGAGGGLIDSLGYPFCRGRLFTKVESDVGQYNDEREIFWATGACMLVRAEAYKKFGGLDEDFFAHMEEIDLCWKIIRSGHRIYYCGKSTIFHVGAGTLGYESPRKTYLNFRNALMLIYKHYSSLELIYKFPLRIALDWLAAFVFLLKGQSGNTLAVLKAHRDLVKQFGALKLKRTAIQQQYPTYSRAQIHRRPILIDYYLLRR